MAEQLPRLDHRFVPMGTDAPDPLPAGELWLDVGSRAAPGVLDHHGGDTPAWSAAQLVLESHGDLVPTDIDDTGTVTLVTHEHPDLDAVCATRLAERQLREGRLTSDHDALERIVQAVSHNDQGLVRTTDPLTCWPVVARETLASGLHDDADRLARGCRLLDRTLAVMEGGSTLAEAATRICDPEIAIALGHARQDYLEDLDRAMLFRVRLPVRSGDGDPQDVPPGPVATPGADRRWSLVDGIVLDDPASSLFKELARGDTERSHGGSGFPLLVVGRETALLSAHGLQRHIISVDPTSGLCLEGLGSRLEGIEARLEDDRGGPTLEGRERPGDGMGRHGYDSKSPWYDGRGHHFTIVDSPGVKLDGRSACGSQLDATRVLDSIWAYGDPARFIRCPEHQVLVARPVQLMDGWEKQGDDAGNLAARCPSLLDEVRLSLQHASARKRQGGWLPWAGDLFDALDDLLWVLPGGHGVWMGRYRLRGDEIDLRSITDEVATFRRLLDERGVPTEAPFVWAGPAVHCVHLRARPEDVSLREPRGASAQAFHRLATGHGVAFDERTAQLDIEGATRVLSRDRRVLTVITDRGTCVVCTRRRTLDDEQGCYHPEAVKLLCGLVAGQRSALQDILAGFAAHAGQGSSRRQQRLILADRRHLLAAEQQLMFERVTDSVFGERLFEEMGRQAGVPDLIAECRQKVEMLAGYVRDRRADFYQRVGFWISFLFGPLLVTAGLFSGIQQTRDFADEYVSLVPADWALTGWIYFAILFLATASVSGLVWLLLSWIHGWEDRRRL